MNDKLQKNISITLVCMFIMTGGVFLRDCAAQVLKAADGMGWDGFSIKDDMKSYEIIRKEHAKEYDDYYNAIRERIVKKLKKVYRDHYSDGDVDLFFIVKSNGSLERIDIDIDRSTKDRRLIDIAILSIQQASPFMPFPKELDASELPFSLTIAFKEKGN